jgi:hypothetical protein
MDESTLRLKAREAMDTGRLSSRRPTRMWGGPGNGASCAVCGQRLGREDMEFELEFAGDDMNTRQTNHHVHIRCFAAWELEREEVLNGASGNLLSAAVDQGTIAARERDSTHR